MSAISLMSAIAGAASGLGLLSLGIFGVSRGAQGRAYELAEIAVFPPAIG